MLICVLCVCLSGGRNVSSSSAAKPAAIGKLSAAWPGVIFPSSSSTSSRKQTREEATQVHICGLIFETRPTLGSFIHPTIRTPLN